MALVARDRSAVLAPCGPAAPRPLRVSVVVPALNEAGSIAAAVASAWQAGADEVVVADGGSTDGTPEIAAAVARVVAAPRGRASQMNAGAAAAAGDVLLFLHADARLPRRASSAIRRVLADPAVGAGAFRMKIDHPATFYRLATVLARARARLCRITLGDQAIFARRELFQSLGGFAPIPLLEDLHLADRLRRRARFRVLPLDVLSSPRRWERRGRLRTSALNWAILALSRAGVAPERLAALYR